MIHHHPISFKRYLANQIQAKRKDVWEWQAEHAKQSPPPFYCSVDLRDAGYKVVPVDSNLYPAGFNNICPDDVRAASPVIRTEIDAIAIARGGRPPERILILPESHTQNAYYIENLYYLAHILSEAGFDTRIGWYALNPDGTSSMQEAVSLTSVTGKQLRAEPIEIRDGRVRAGKFEPDFILLNNDFSSGYPKPLDAVTQPIVPSHALGWHSRKKSEHFARYNRLAAEFAEIVEIDPWTIQVDTEAVGPVNFNEELGIDETAAAVDRVLARIQSKYDEHDVVHQPFAFVKNNTGTYGMGIIVVRSGEELRHLNRREKNKMSVGKNRKPIESVIVQEGIPTATIIDRLAAEPVIYLVGTNLIGGFLRTNPERGTEDNLNAQGMVFRKLCMSDLRKPGDEEADFDDSRAAEEPVLELVYGSIARISALATGMELAEHRG